jgi:putative transposase
MGGHTYTNLLTHIVFSTKDRLPYLLSERKDDLFAYMGGIVRGVGSEPLIINGPADHVHLLIRTAGLIAVADLVRLVKTTPRDGYMKSAS